MISPASPRILHVASVATVATHPGVAIVASVATPDRLRSCCSRLVATVATREFHVATTKPLIGKASGHSSHTGHTRRTYSKSPLGIGRCGWAVGGRRGRASILSLRCGYCGQCGHWPDFSSTYQWPQQIAMWPLWPLRRTGVAALGPTVSDVRMPARGPPISTHSDHSGRRRPAPPRTEPSSP